MGSDRAHDDDGFRWPDGRRAALSISFDDARPSQVDRGLPILDAHGVKGTFYVSPRSVKQRLDGWHAAVAHGHEIGNHSLSHPCSGNFVQARRNPLEHFTLDRIEQDLLAANRAIEELLDVTPLTYAYPCGQTFVGRGVDQHSYVPVVARHFVAGRRAFDETHNSPVYCDLAMLTSMDADCADFGHLLKLVQAALDDGGWLVLMCHDVGESGRQVTRADALDELCRFATDPAGGLWVGTVATIAAHVARARSEGHST